MPFSHLVKACRSWVNSQETDDRGITRCKKTVRVLYKAALPAIDLAARCNLDCVWLLGIVKRSGRRVDDNTPPAA